MCSTLKDTKTLRFQDAYSWLCSFEKHGWIFGLERITVLLEHLGNPHHGLRMIHVAGTNGKGSVCKYISSILRKAGYRVGSYLSPHVEHFSERIVINNQDISQEDFTCLVSQVKPVVEEMKQQGNSPTFFEIVTALAFLHFKQCSVDYAVVEVGLGGRFDATNVVTPLVSVITNISLEHTDILGKEIRLIASEKAGIIKDHVPVISGAVGDALVVIGQIASQQDAPVTWVDQSMWTRTSYKEGCQEFLVQGSFKEYMVQTSMLGRYQGENITLAIAAVERLQMAGVYLTDNDILGGIKTATHPGRMEIISADPLILLDGAHNPAGMSMLVKTLDEDFSAHRFVVVLGVLKDKDMKTMVSTIVPMADVFIVTRSQNPRAADPVILKEMITALDSDKTVFAEDSVPQALDHAKLLVQYNDMICVTGSLFTVGEARSYILLHPKTDLSVS